MTNFKIAIMYSEHSANTEDFVFYQVRSLSMGIHNLQYFTDMQQAMKWLLSWKSHFCGKTHAP